MRVERPSPFRRQEYRDDFELTGRCYNFFRDGGLVRNNDACFAATPEGLVRRRSIKIDYLTQLVKRLPTQISGIESISIRNYNFHCLSS